MQYRQRARAIRSSALRSRRTAAAAIAALAVLAAVAIPSTGAYFTADATTGGNTAAAASLPAVTGLTAAKAGAALGQSTTVSWTPAAAPAGSGAVTYSLERSSTADFAAPTTVYTGTATSATDTTAGAAVAAAAVAADVDTTNAGSCVVSAANNSLYCWGSWLGGRNGDGDSRERYAPVRVKTEGTGLNPADVTQISSGSNSCALTKQGRVWCWGLWVGDGRMPDSMHWATGSTVPQEVPLRGVLAGRTVMQIVTDNGTEDGGACVLTDAGTVVCWGFAWSKKWGSNEVIQSAPILVDTGVLANADVVRLASVGEAVCALTLNYRVACWGDNRYGVLGTGGGSTETAVPAWIALSSGYSTRFSALTGGTNRVNGASAVDEEPGSPSGACGLTLTDSIYCWGHLGDGWLGSSATPVKIPLGSLKEIRAIEKTSDGICAINASQQLFCWGRDTAGELGLGGGGKVYTQPTRVEGGLLAGKRIASVSSNGSLTTCALTTDGVLACFGQNRLGSLGIGSTDLLATVTTPTADPMSKAPPAGWNCPAGTVLLAGATCSLDTAGNYFYRVSYRVGGATNWVSPSTTASRG